MKQPLMLQSDCIDCKFYEGFGQCYRHGNDLIDNCKDYEENKDFEYLDLSFQQYEQQKE